MKETRWDYFKEQEGVSVVPGDELNFAGSERKTYAPLKRKSLPSEDCDWLTLKK